MRFTCALCPTCTNTAGGILAHAVTAHPETGDLPTTWPHGPDVEASEQPDFAALARGSLYTAKAWEKAWYVLWMPAAWDTLVSLVGIGNHPVAAASALSRAMGPASRIATLTNPSMDRRDVQVETAVGQDVTHTKTWRREDFR